MQCLAKNPDDRWQTAGDLKRELKWLHAEITGGTSGSRTYSAESIYGPSINRWLVVAVVGAPLAALAVSVGYQIFGSPQSADLVICKFAVTIDDFEAEFSKSCHHLS